MKLIQNSNFRVQGMFFNNCIEKNQNKTYLEEGTSESPYYLAIIPPRIYANISIIKNLQHNFPKMRGWGGGGGVEGPLEFLRKFFRFGNATLLLNKGGERAAIGCPVQSGCMFSLEAVSIICHTERAMEFSLLLMFSLYSIRDFPHFQYCSVQGGGDGANPS